MSGELRMYMRKKRPARKTHHVVHWADGGETSLANTILLCSKHHRLLHEGGFEIKPGAEGEWHFRNASGLKNAVI